MHSKIPVITISILVLLSLPLFGRTVRLIDGSFLQGEILQHNDKGILFKCWDTDGVIDIPWDMLFLQDSLALKQEFGLLTEQVSEFQINGTRVYLKSGVMVDGVFLSQDQNRLVLKTSSGEIPIPKENILKTEEKKFEISEVYTPNEIYQEWKGKYALDTAEGNYQFGEFLMNIPYYEKAAFHFKEAQRISPDMEKKVSVYLEKINLLKAQKEINSLSFMVTRFIQNYEYGKAEECIKKLETEYKDYKLPKSIEELRKDLEDHKKKYLTARVEKIWFQKMDQKIRLKASERKCTLAEARDYVGSGMDGEIKKELSAQFGISEGEVQQYFEEREGKNTYRYSFGSGTFIVGLCAEDTGSKKKGEPDQIEQIQRMIRSLRESKASSEPQKLLNGEDWWNLAPSSTRIEWLKAYYTSRRLKVIREETSTCKDCAGTGLIKNLGLGKDVNTICPRCHGLRMDRTVVGK